MESPQVEYAGFWIRVWASIIDSVILGVLLYPLLTAIYGSQYWSSTDFVQGPADFLISWVLPAIAVVWFWLARQATPGKMAVGVRIVDAETGNNPGATQLVVRYLSYFVSAIPLCLGLFWVGFDARKQGWHDKLARTVVVHKKRGGALAAKPGEQWPE
ncbi:MAG: RDD family protein [Polaromonas sp.]|nr:RDD family protein [Polaromonas sp.]